MEFAGPSILPDGRRTDRAVPRAARNANAAARDDPHLEPRHGHQSRRLRQGEDQGPRAGAFRNPLSERQGPRAAARRCRHRRLRHVVLSKSRRQQRPACDRRTRAHGPHRLWHAGCAGHGSRQICRQDRCRARCRPFRGGHADRSRAARRGGARYQARLAVARRRSCKGLRRRQQRQACRARRTGLHLRRARGCRKDWGRDRLRCHPHLGVRRTPQDFSSRLLRCAECGCGRVGGVDRLPSRSLVPVRAAAAARSRDRGPRCARAAHRPHGPAKDESSACCAADESARKAGGAGCGCS